MTSRIHQLNDTEKLMERLDIERKRTDWGGIATSSAWNGARGMKQALEEIRRDRMEELVTATGRQVLYLQAMCDTLQQVIEMPDTMVSLHQEMEQMDREAAERESARAAKDGGRSNGITRRIRAIRRW